VGSGRGESYIMIQLADILHILHCKKSHEHDQTLTSVKENNSNDCLYYIEEAITEPWGMPEHVKWLKEAKKVCDTTQLSEATIVSDLIKILPAISAITQGVNGKNYLRDIVARVLSLL
jgi:hypothetical protein